MQIENTMYEDTADNDETDRLQITECMVTLAEKVNVGCKLQGYSRREN